MSFLTGKLRAWKEEMKYSDSSQIRVKTYIEIGLLIPHLSQRKEKETNICWAPYYKPDPSPKYFT